MIPQKATRLLSRRFLKYSSVSVRHHNFDGETPHKTHLSMVVREDESHNYVTAYSNFGFRFSTGLGVLGPCALFPRLVLHWNVWSAKDITPESLALFCVLEPKLDILVIGKGDEDAKVDNKIYKYLRSKNINVEILPTEQACATFNFLNIDRRAVAAAVIPPTNITDEIDESLSMLKFQDGLITEEEKIDKAIEDIQASMKEKSLAQLLDDFKAKKKQDSQNELPGGKDNNEKER
ncbi:hypothetical protein BsWGS_11228 [Bradybaena similaris]